MVTTLVHHCIQEMLPLRRKKAVAHLPTIWVFSGHAKISLEPAMFRDSFAGILPPEIEAETPSFDVGQGLLFVKQFSIDLDALGSNQLVLCSENNRFTIDLKRDSEGNAFSFSRCPNARSLEVVRPLIAQLSSGIISPIGNDVVKELIEQHHDAAINGRFDTCEQFPAPPANDQRSNPYACAYPPSTCPLGAFYHTGLN